MGVELDLGKLACLKNYRVAGLGALPAQSRVLIDAKEDAVQLILVKKRKRILKGAGFGLFIIIAGVPCIGHLDAWLLRRGFGGAIIDNDTSPRRRGEEEGDSEGG